jgi:hypothetical protein
MKDYSTGHDYNSKEGIILLINRFIKMIKVDFVCIGKKKNILLEIYGPVEGDIALRIC